MGIEIVAFISATAFSMKIQMNKQPGKEINGKMKIKGMRKSEHFSFE